MGAAAVNRSALRPSRVISPSPPDQIELLQRMTQVLGSHFDVSLPVPGLTNGLGSIDVKNAKEFSVGLLEPGKKHIWQDGIRRLSLRDRTTIAGSLFLWRKTLPSSAAAPSEHMSRVTAPELTPPPGYIQHIVQIVEGCFPVGWDSAYINCVERAVPTVKSVLSRGRGKGGWRSMGPDRYEYGRACMGETDPLVSEFGSRVRFMAAKCDGKSRDVTVMSEDAQFLKPLHKLLYDQISKFPWLLRGKAKPSTFKHFKRKSGQVFVSGDYECATDNLPVSTAEWILRAAFRRARHIPEAVQVAALRYLRVTVMYPGGEEARATRQLMGSLLCFPLLCLQNYCAFRWVFGPEVPVKINGDDIVFRSSRAEYERWADFVGSVGLKLSRGKTLVSTSIFSLNSTFFWSSKQTVRLVPVIRCCTLLAEKSPYPASLAGSLRGFLEGFRGEIKEALGAWFLERKRRLIGKSGRSVVRGLRMAVTEGMLKASGLWLRELWFVNSVPDRWEDHYGLSWTAPEEALPPLPQAPDRLVGQVKLPPNWFLKPLPRKPRERKEVLTKEREFWEEVTDLSWGSKYRPRDVEQEFWRETERTGVECYWRQWQRPVQTRAYRALARRLDLKGPRSALNRGKLYAILRRRVQSEKKVWVLREEEEHPEEAWPLWFECPSNWGLDRVRPADELTVRKFPVRRWLGFEASAARFLQ